MTRDTQKRLLALVRELEDLIRDQDVDGDRAAPAPEVADRVLSVRQVADRLGRSLDWVYEHQKELPFRVSMIGKGVKFSARGLEEYLRRQRAS